ncbi:hypothetical protein JHK85_012598 [Glycine max]|uniref:Uncharacterized protein n=1 Tax=Glycine soja TaxID=3848 RepID=A0A0B2NVX8_GLYSO|nr:hypothetical protein JHK85_012598 [Glycine max]KHN01266.1 hypothetical protein glysoja_045176 [Glycine soja]
MGTASRVEGSKRTPYDTPAMRKLLLDDSQLQQRKRMAHKKQAIDRGRPKR